MIEPYRTEVDPPLLPLRRGSTGPGVQRVQEWLGLHGIGVLIDGDFGPATEAAVKRFVGSPLGVVDRKVWRALTLPLQQVTTMSVPAGFGAAVVALGHAYLNAQAREVGGDNKGPWVRHVCRGFSVAGARASPRRSTPRPRERWGRSPPSIPCSTASGASTCPAW